MNVQHVLNILKEARDWAATRTTERDQKQAREIRAHVLRAAKSGTEPGVQEEGTWVLVYLRKMNKTKDRERHIAALEAALAPSPQPSTEA